MSQTTYSTSATARLTGISRQAIRAYASRYRKFLSPQARVDQMLQELGEARGKLAERPGRYIAPAWWRALFGGRVD